MAIAEVRLELVFPEGEVKQGSLQEATLEIEADSLQNFEIQSLKALSPGETIYFHKLSPLMKKEADGKYTSEVSVVFLKVPESNSLDFSITDQKISLTWNGIRVIPTEVSKGMIFEAFEIPARKRVLFWLICCLLAVVTGIGIYIINKRVKTTRNKKLHRQKLKDLIFSASSYDEIIAIWQKKSLLQEEFPHTTESFKNLEKTLFKYVFKPHQSENEKIEIQKAYRGFINEVQGGFNGI